MHVFFKRFILWAVCSLVMQSKMKASLTYFAPTPLNTSHKPVINHFFFLSLNFSVNSRPTFFSNPTHPNQKFSGPTLITEPAHSCFILISSILTLISITDLFFGRVSRNKPSYYCVLTLWGTINLPHFHSINHLASFHFRFLVCHISCFNWGNIIAIIIMFLISHHDGRSFALIR